MADESKTISKKFNHEILDVIKDIHRRKKRADLESIFVAAKDKDLSHEEIEIILEELCNEGLLKPTSRAGRISYLSCKNDREMIFSDDDMTEVNEESEKNDKGDVHNNIQTQELESTHFSILEHFSKEIVDLKEYIYFEINKVNATKSTEFIDHLKEENIFLKKELKETRDLVKNIFENISRQNQSSETAKTNKDFSNYNSNKDFSKWKQVPMGKYLTQKQKNISKNLFIANRYDLMSQDDDCERGTVNNDDHDENIENNDINNNNNIFTPILSNSSKTRPNPVINQHPERESSFVTRSTVNINRNKIKIICDSIPKGIRLREFNKNINNGNAKIKCFPGSTVKQLNHYSLPTLSEEKPNTVLRHVGINDLMSTRENKTPDDKIAIEIMNIGRSYVEYGVLFRA